MIDLDDLGARVRAQAASAELGLDEIAARAGRRRKRRLAARLVSVAVGLVVLAGFVLVLAGDDESTSVITDPGGEGSLGSGRVVWPGESVSFGDAQSLATAFRDRFLDDAWTFEVSAASTGGEAFVSFRGPDGAFALGFAELLDGRAVFTSVDADGSLVLRRDGTVALEGDQGDPPDSVDILHRPSGSAATLRTDDERPDGAWTLPGAGGAGGVGTILMIERGPDGEVLGMRGAAIDGVGTTIDIGDLGSPVAAENVPSIWAQPDRDEIWVNVRRVSIDNGFDAVVGQSGDQRLVCVALDDPQSGTTAGTCSPTWRFLTGGIAIGMQSPKDRLTIVALPVAVTDEQVADVGHAVDNGQIVVVDPNPPDRLEITSPERVLVVRLGT